MEVKWCLSVLIDVCVENGVGLAVSKILIYSFYKSEWSVGEYEHEKYKKTGSPYGGAGYCPRGQYSSRLRR